MPAPEELGLNLDDEG